MARIRTKAKAASLRSKEKLRSSNLLMDKNTLPGAQCGFFAFCGERERDTVNQRSTKKNEVPLGNVQDLYVS